MDESEKKKLVDTLNKINRSVCEAIFAFNHDRNRYKLDKTCERLFKRREELELQAKQNGLKLVEVPLDPGETRAWAKLELQEINENTCN